MKNRIPTINKILDNIESIQKTSNVKLDELVKALSK